VQAGTLGGDGQRQRTGHGAGQVSNGATLLIDKVDLITGGLTLNGSGVGGAGALQGAGTASHAGTVTLATASAIGAATASDTLTVKNQVSGTGPLTKVGDGIELFGATPTPAARRSRPARWLPETPMPSVTTLCGSTTGLRS
jgi:hypothetical protein